MANARKRRISRNRRTARKDAEKIKQQFRMGKLSMSEYLGIVKAGSSHGARLLRHEAEQRLKQMRRVSCEPGEKKPIPAAKAPPVTGLTRAQQRARESFRRERQRAAVATVTPALTQTPETRFKGR